LAAHKAVSGVRWDGSPAAHVAEFPMFHFEFPSLGFEFPSVPSQFSDPEKTTEFFPPNTAYL